MTASSTPRPQAVAGRKPQQAAAGRHRAPQAPEAAAGPGRPRQAPAGRGRPRHLRARRALRALRDLRNLRDLRDLRATRGSVASGRTLSLRWRPTLWRVTAPCCRLKRRPCGGVYRGNGEGTPTGGSLFTQTLTDAHHRHSQGLNIVALGQKSYAHHTRPGGRRGAGVEDSGVVFAIKSV